MNKKSYICYKVVLMWVLCQAIGVYADLPLKGTGQEAPQGWPISLWQKCWNTEREYVDFTQNAWVNLPFDQQAAYARAYQEWYAKSKGEPIEKKINAGPINVRMVLIPPGKFWMGAENEDWGYRDPHRVTITEGYWLGKYEITQREWLQVMQDNPSMFKGEDLPVDWMTWEQCQEFCRRTGLSLPTEAQWEYACRAGTLTSFNLGEYISLDQVNYNGLFPNREVKGEPRWKTVAVGSLSNSNSWGCYDMHGNVAEWCADHAESVIEITVTHIDGIENPIGKKGSKRVYRGGRWGVYAGFCRSGFRSICDYDSEILGLGFRVCKSLAKK